MRKKSRRDVEVFSLAFLDVICCGFGAIILLLVLVKVGEPRALEAMEAEQKGLVAKLQEELYEIRGETNVFNRDLITKREQISKEKVKGYIGEVRAFGVTDDDSTFVLWTSSWESSEGGVQEFCDPIYRALLAALKSHFAS